MCSCLQIAKAFGGRQISVVDVSDAKLSNALQMGATHGVNGAKENVVDRIKVIVLTLAFKFGEILSFITIIRFP